MVAGVADLSTITSSNNTSSFAQNSIPITGLLGKVAKLRLLCGRQFTNNCRLGIDDQLTSNIRKLANPQALAPTNNQVELPSKPGIQVLYLSALVPHPPPAFAASQWSYPYRHLFYRLFDARSFQRLVHILLVWSLFSPGGLIPGFIPSIGVGNIVRPPPSGVAGFMTMSTAGYGQENPSTHGCISQATRAGSRLFTPTTGSRKFVRE